MIDLDYTANTPVDERVLARFCETERLCIGNANSRHAAGRQAAEILHASLQHMAQMLGAKETEIIQTSGASESNNTAIKGILRAKPTRWAARYHHAAGTCVGERLSDGDAGAGRADRRGIDRPTGARNPGGAGRTAAQGYGAGDDQRGRQRAGRGAAGAGNRPDAGGLSALQAARGRDAGGRQDSDILSICGHDEPWPRTNSTV